MRRHLDHLLRLGLCLLSALLPGLAAAQCGAVSTGNVIYAGYNLSLSNNVTVNGNNVSGTGNTLASNGQRSNNSYSTPDPVPASFPSFSSGNNSNGGSVAAGTYSSVSGSNISFTGGTYYITNLNSSGNLSFAAGNYYVSSWTLSNNTVVTTAANTRIYIGSVVNGGNNVKINSSGSASNLLLTVYGTASINFSNNTNFVGNIYSNSLSASVTFSNNAVFTGAIFSAGNVTFGNNGTLTYSGSGTGGGGIDTCGLTANYRFDECSYSGISGEVTDSGGNGNSATAMQGATTANTAPRIVNSYADLRASTGARYISPVTPYALGSNWTISTWVKFPFNTGGSQYHVLGSVSGGGDLMFMDGSQNFLWGSYQPGNIAYGSYKLGTLASGWHHLALVGSGSKTLLYIDGSQVDSVNAQTTGSLAFIGASYDSDQGTQEGMNAAMDEYMVFSTALDASSISSIYSNQAAGKNYDGSSRPATTCTLAVASFTISGTGSASTCVAQPLTITAKDASGNTLTGYTGTINLTTSSGKGTWAAGTGPAPSGSLSVGNNNGQASYTFAAGDAGVVRLTLAEDLSQTTTVTVADSSVGVSSTSASIQYSDNAFVWTETSDYWQGNWISVAGRPHALQIALWQKDTSKPAGTCAIATSYTGNHGLKLWRTDSAGPWTAPTIASPSLSIPSSQPASANATLAFSHGVASISLGTTDVGIYSFSVLDDSLQYVSKAVSGSSSTLIVRPFAVTISGLSLGATSNPGNAAATGSVFGAAGASFSATVSAYRWSAAASDTTGKPLPGATLSTIQAGGLTPGFTGPVALTASSGTQTPSGGLMGAFGLVSGSTIGSASITLSNGTASPGTLAYSEVGSFQLNTAGVATFGSSPSASIDAYFFNASGTQTSPAVVGRFIPAGFGVSSTSTTQRSDLPSCSNSGFTYLGEPFTATFTLTAQNALGNTTQNYATSLGYAKLTLNQNSAQTSASSTNSLNPSGISGSTTFAASAMGGYLNNTVSFSAPGSPGGVGGGVASTVQLVLAPARPVGAPVGPYGNPLTHTAGANFGIAPLDTDNVGLMSSSLNLATNYPSTTSNSSLVATVPLLYGRLRLQNAIGSQYRNLALPLQAQYWNGSAFALNTLDSCTSISSSQLSFGNYRNTMTSSDAGVAGNPVTLSNGAASLLLNKPTGNHSGSYDLAIALSATAVDASCVSWTRSPAATSGAGMTYLQGSWCASSYVKDPSARASFGLYTGNNATVYQRENY